MVSVDRWSLYGGVLVQLKWTMNQPTVVFKTGVIVHVVRYLRSCDLHLQLTTVCMCKLGSLFDQTVDMFCGSIKNL